MPIISRIGGGGATTLPASGRPLNEYTWDQIYMVGSAGAAAEYWSVGDEKTITLSTSEVMDIQIIGFAHDNISGAGGTKAPITFCFKNCMSTKRGINTSNTNVGGYSGCALYPIINGAIYNSLPSDLRAVMKNVSKLTSAGNKSSTIITTQERLFLLSEVEIFGATTLSKPGEGTQYAFFTNGGSRVKTVNGIASIWWERSPSGADALYFCNVYNGMANHGSPTAEYGVALGFCV